jgi:hypothetical protein
MEHNGIPFNQSLFYKFQENWHKIQNGLTARIDLSRLPAKQGRVVLLQPGPIRKIPNRKRNWLADSGERRA